MNEITLPQELNDLDKSILVARHFGKVMNVFRPLVYSVYKNELWKERFSSFGEYVESAEGLGMSQGYASKLKQVEEHYVIEGGLSPEKLEGIDYERLYAASKLPGTPEEHAAIAKTLTRREIRETQNEAEETPHEHSPICGICRIKL